MLNSEMLVRATNTTPLYFAGDFVLTTQQIADAAGIPAGNMRRNFCNNQYDFYQYLDFYKLQGIEAAKYSRLIHEHEHIRQAVSEVNSQQIRKLTLWTYTGCVKLLGLSQKTSKLTFEEVVELAKALYTFSPIPPATAEIPTQTSTTNHANTAKNIDVITKAITELVTSIVDNSEKLDSMQRQLDALNNVHPQGDTRQQIWTNVNAFADKMGIEHREAWHIFYNSYNAAYRTNLTTKFNNYRIKYQKPEHYNRLDYLQDTDGLNDALRIAQKLNDTPSGVVH